MGTNLPLQEKIEEMRTYAELVLQIPQIKNKKTTGVYVRVYNRETTNLVIGETFGTFAHGYLKESNSSHQKARWLYLHPHAISTTESNGEVDAGGIKGKNHIIGVSGFDVFNYNSALAILLLACFEHEPSNGSWHVMQEYAKRAQCETELNWLLEHMQALPIPSRFATVVTKFFSWLHKEKK
ncbi:hypothetical protein C4565_02760 [Candidatus Parcubacteria bacterium]|jgi:hypothetical protein|nr:MAG: hypothetical protein C4565_02760 [Candidatus Parcubacteria bacterium]